MDVDPLSAYENEMWAEFVAAHGARSGLQSLVAPVVAAGTVMASAAIVWAVSEVVARLGRMLGLGGCNRGGATADATDRRPSASPNSDRRDRR